MRRWPLPKIRSKCSCLSTSKSPVLDPIKILMPQAGCTLLSASRLSLVAPIKNPKLAAQLEAARASFQSSCFWSVVGGLQLGISRKLVTPPRTAARDPEARSSLSVAPGSRKCTWGSITPGISNRPAASMCSRPTALIMLSIFAIRPFWQATSPAAVVPSGWAMEALRMTRSYMDSKRV